MFGCRMVNGVCGLKETNRYAYRMVSEECCLKFTGLIIELSVGTVFNNSQVLLGNFQQESGFKFTGLEVKYDR